MILLLRILPLLVGVLEALVFTSQRNSPQSYPWMVGVGIVALPLASLVIAWKRIRFLDLLEKMLPSYLLMASLGFGLLLVEGALAYWALVGIAALTAVLSLELLFLLAYDPAAYPVNGLSRLNIAYVPLCVYYAMSTSTGLMAFLHSPREWHLFIGLILGVVLYRTTGHPTATRHQHRVWMIVGGLVGFQVAAIGLLLPLSMQMQGIVAAFILSAVLRMRRYVYEPRPSARTAWAESLAIGVVFMVCLVTAKWV